MKKSLKAALQATLIAAVFLGICELGFWLRYYFYGIRHLDVIQTVMFALTLGVWIYGFVGIRKYWK